MEQHQREVEADRCYEQQNTTLAAERVFDEGDGGGLHARYLHRGAVCPHHSIRVGDA
jgi:hypothetical protein